MCTQNALSYLTQAKIEDKKKEAIETGLDKYKDLCKKALDENKVRYIYVMKKNNYVNQ